MNRSLIADKVKHLIRLSVYDKECLRRSAAGSDVGDMTPLGTLSELRIAAEVRFEFVFDHFIFAIVAGMAIRLSDSDIMTI